MTSFKHRLKRKRARQTYRKKKVKAAEKKRQRRR